MDNEKLLKDKTILITGANGILELIIMVWQSHLSGEVRAIVPVTQNHFDFAWLIKTYWNIACQGQSRYSGALAAFTSSVPVSNLPKTKLWILAGSPSPEWWLSKSGSVAQSAPV